MKTLIKVSQCFQAFFLFFSFSSARNVDEESVPSAPNERIVEECFLTFPFCSLGLEIKQELKSCQSIIWAHFFPSFLIRSSLNANDGIKTFQQWGIFCEISLCIFLEKKFARPSGDSCGYKNKVSSFEGEKIWWK